MNPRKSLCLLSFAACAAFPSAAETGAHTHFSFVKEDVLIERPEGMSSAGPYYTTLVPMDAVEVVAYEHALYFSTDHDEGQGGIWLYLCNGDPSKVANWTSYDDAVAAGDFDYLAEKPAANPVFIDTVQGRQTETPHANVIGGTVYMTYHNADAGRNQSTLLATSPDGVNFARIHGDRDSIILDDQEGPGDGHTGYFRWGPNPFSDIDYKYVGYSLHGGGINFHSAIWASDDAIDWRKLEVLTPREGHAIEDDTLIIWHELDPNSITDLGDGEYVALCAGGNRASGSMGRRVELYEIFLAGDGRTLTRGARKVLPQGPEGSFDAEEVSEPATIRIGDTWHMIYVGVKDGGEMNTVMSASGKLNADAPLNAKLHPEDQQRHFGK